MISMLPFVLRLFIIEHDSSGLTFHLFRDGGVEVIAYRKPAFAGSMQFTKDGRRLKWRCVIFTESKTVHTV
jgi:hypothetical protein